MGVWCGPAGAFLNLALAATMWRGELWPRVAIFAVAGTVAVGCRLSCAPVVTALFVILAIEEGGTRRWLKALGICLGVAVLFFGPFLAADPSNFFYDLWSYHMGAAFDRNFTAQAMQWWNVSPAAIMVLLVGLFGTGRLVAKRKWSEVVLLAAAVIALSFKEVGSIQTH